MKKWHKSNPELFVKNPAIVRDVTLLQGRQLALATLSNCRNFRLVESHEAVHRIRENGVSFPTLIYIRVSLRLPCTELDYS